MGSEMCIRDRGRDRGRLTPYYPSKCSESRAEHVRLPRIMLLRPVKVLRPVVGRYPIIVVGGAEGLESIDRGRVCVCVARLVQFKNIYSRMSHWTDSLKLNKCGF